MHILEALLSSLALSANSFARKWLYHNPPFKAGDKHSRTEARKNKALTQEMRFRFDGLQVMQQLLGLIVDLLRCECQATGLDSKRPGNRLQSL
jgi:hypothetical protein